jgi:fructose-bisphosphate aldolase class II
MGGTIMSLARLTDLLGPAAATGTGMGAFNVFSIEHAEALVWGAEQAGTPVVLQISQNAVRYHRSLAPIALATLAIARASAVPTVVHLDHCTDVDLVREAVELGLTSVMFDGSELDYDANVATTADVVRMCHERGIDVEAELGEVGGKDGVHAPGARTKPDEATAFVTATGIDALAVAVGSSHAMTERSARLDLDLITELKAAVDVPLVLHGSSGVPDDVLAAAIRAGMTKINVSTHLNGFFTRAIRSALDADPSIVDSRRDVSAGRAAVASEAERMLRLFALQTAPLRVAS